MASDGRSSGVSLPHLSVLLLIIASATSSVSPSYHGYKWVRFNANGGVARWLEELQEYAFDIDERTSERRILVDVFSEPTKLQPWADVLVAPDFYDVFRSLLKRQGVLEVEVLKSNFQRVIDSELQDIEETRERRRRRKRQNNVNNNSFAFDDENYHSYDQMVTFMRDLTARFSHIATLANVSTSFEGRTIYGVKIASSHTFKPAIVIDAGVHAREWIAPAAAVYILKKLVTSYGRDARLTRAVDAFDWHIIPQVNPDGYEYSMWTDRLWRKTRSRNSSANKWCIGADANRNWGYRWGEAGANRAPCSNIYQGSAPFSEKEIVGLKEYMTWRIPNLVIYLSLHAYGQVFLSPWGYTSKRPENYVDQRNAASAAVQAMKRLTGVSYNFGTISEVMYPASGTSIDFMQSRSVPFIYGVELRPADTRGAVAFAIPPSNIKPTGDELLEGALAIADYYQHHKGSG